MRCLSVHLTDLCNSRCSFCVVGSPLYVKDSIDIGLVRRFLCENADKGYTAVNLHGGEATVHPNFLEILELIVDLGYEEIHLQTNAIRIADRDFARALRDRRVNLFIISLHGDDEHLHDDQTGSIGGFAKTINGICNVKALGAKVRTNTVITCQNLNRLSKIAQLTCDLDVDHVNFSNLHPVGSTLFSFDRMVPKISGIQGHLYPAIEVALAAGKVVTLEGFPYCTITRYAHLHLNETRREIRMLMRGNIIDDYDTFMNAACRVLGPPCQMCAVAEKCGGVYPEYSARLGWGEFDAIAS